ncbi:MAG: DUF4358 domain-containing protein [Clostridiales bacterium]|nr:DUF4358 domain-containing protein [Clostridiales bacterium]
MSIKNKVLSVICVVMLFTLVCQSGCAKRNDASVDIDTLRDAMLESFGDTADMTTVDSSFENAEELFAYACDIDYSLVRSYFLSYSTLGNADEIAVAQLESEDSAKLAQKAFQKHLESRKKLFRQYAPEQLKRTDNAKIFASGNYAVLIIADNAEEIKKVFEELTGE